MCSTHELVEVIIDCMNCITSASARGRKIPGYAALMMRCAQPQCVLSARELLPRDVVVFVVD